VEVLVEVLSCFQHSDRQDPSSERGKMSRRAERSDFSLLLFNHKSGNAAPRDQSVFIPALGISFGAASGSSKLLVGNNAVEMVAPRGQHMVMCKHAGRLLSIMLQYQAFWKPALDVARSPASHLVCIPSYSLG
jgi:hypothetical protein